MAISTTQEGIFASDLKSLSGKELMEKLNTLKGSVKIAGYRSKVPIPKDPATYSSNQNLLNNCQELPVDKALDALEQELKLIMTNNPWVFSMYFLRSYIEGYTDDHEALSQSILSTLTKCIETLLKRMSTDEINYENIRRICNFIYSINMVIENHPNHITQDCIIIEQAYAGESYNELLGTRGTLNCVCLAIKDVKTGKVSFAHIDSFVTKESLEKTIERSFPNSNNLIACLFGGALNDIFTMHNTKKIIDALPDHVKIISADIENLELDNLHKDLYSLSPTFVVNPKTFKITNSCPVYLTNNVISSIIQFNYHHTKLKDTYPNSCKNNLHMSYTNGHHIPLLVTDEFINLHDPIKTSLIEMISDMEKEDNNYKKLKNCFPYKILLSLEIRKVINSLKQQIVDTAKDKNITLSHDNIDNIMETIKSINLYIGPNACEANKPIFDFIENHLFKDGNTLDLDGLSKIQMDHDSHCYLQPAKDISKTTAEDMEELVENMELFANFH